VILTAAVASAIVALTSSAVRTDVFPGRGGESGILDVPTADVLSPRSGTLASELSISRVPGTVGTTVSPLPLSVVTGVAKGLEAGVSLRHWGRPGDPAPTPTLFAGALKLHIADAAAFRPAIAVDAYVDRANANGTAGARAIATSPGLGRLRVSAFAGVDRLLDAPAGFGATGGLAGSVDLADRLDLAADAVLTRDGPMTGAALRWQLTPAMGVTFGCDWTPRDGGLRFGFGFAVAARPARRAAVAAAAPTPAPVFDTPAKAPAAPQFTDDRPHFRMRLDLAPESPQREHFVALAPSSTTGRAAAKPSAEDAANRALLAAAERLDAVERRLRSADGALVTRQERLEATRDRISRREAELQARGAELDARERALRVTGSAGYRELQLADAEESARAAERAAESQERSNALVVEGAAGRERVAHEREAEVTAAASAAPTPAEREAALRRRSDRLAATRERLEATDVALTAAGNRIDAIERRLALQADREALLERRARAGGGAPADAPAPAGTPGADQRRAVLAHRPEIEGCIAGGLSRRSLVRSDGVLRVRVDADGRVTEVSYATEAGATLDNACLEKAAQGWSLPPAAAGYVVEVPMTVVTSGAAR
jgi:hypothetical protein